jgi:FtsP/CotA-like multicopper oxidase with cupredoxin domain
MSHLNKKNFTVVIMRILPVLLAGMALLFAAPARAATPGITSASLTPVFNLNAGDGYSTQPDGAMIYSWGYGCSTAPTFAPLVFGSIGVCPTMQIPGPTLIVTEGDSVTVNLTNNLPKGVGNTSILFPGFVVTSTGGVQGILTQEAAPLTTIIYKFVATTPGTHAYYSGTQPDLQVEMGLYGALIVLPKNPPTTCTALEHENSGFRTDYRLAPSAYDHPATCYDREYLFQWAEMDSRIHRQAEEQEIQLRTCIPSPTSVCQLHVKTEPYRPNYFLINGRSMPDDMDANYAPNYPNQPYNGNPHMNPGDLVLLRVIGQGRLQNPFHEHANHVRILARDGNLILSQHDPQASVPSAARLAGRMEFTTDTTPGQAFDGIFYYTGKGLNWDMYAHREGDGSVCVPDANGYYTAASGATPPHYAGGVMTSGSTNYYEWCADHNHPLEANPAGVVAGGGPVTLPDPNISTNGLWFNGTPYLGPDAVFNASGKTPLPPGTALQNPPAESGIAFMWHSHNEREITTNDVFPGGMLMMMLVDPPVWFIDETL